MKHYSQRGSIHLGIFLIAAVAVVVAFVGYEVIKTNRAVAPPATTNSVLPQTAASAPAINNAAGLNSAENSLNSTNLDQGLDPNSYSSDVNSLL